MSFDTRIEENEEEKVCNNDPLNFELSSLWKLKKVTIVPVLPGALGATNNVNMDKENWYQLHSGNVTKRKPLRNRKK